MTAATATVQRRVLAPNARRCPEGVVVDAGLDHPNIAPKKPHPESTMNYRHDTEADGVAQARNLLAEAAQEVERLENVASRTFCRLTALAAMLPQLERVVVHKPEAIETVTLDPARARREAQLLLRYINASEGSIGSLRNLVHFLSLGL